MVKGKRTGRLTKKMRGKMKFTFVCILVLFFLLVGRLIYHTVRNGDRYETIVLGQQKKDSTDLAFERGQIFDRNGNILATNEKIYTLILEPQNILTEYVIKGTRQKLYYEPTIDALVEYMGLDRQELVKAIEDNPTSYYTVFKTGLSFDQVSKMKDILNLSKMSSINMTEEERALAKKTKNIIGVRFEESYKRVYPYDSLACRVLGFVSDGKEGRWGLEQYYNDELNGQDGRAYYYFDEELTREQTVKEPENGNSIVSTIDMSIQKIIEDAIATFDKGIGSKQVSILVMNPKDGEVYGMASSHPYNLNDPMNQEIFLKTYGQKKVEDMADYTIYKAEKEKRLAAEKEAKAAEKAQKEAEAKNKRRRNEKKTSADAQTGVKTVDGQVTGEAVDDQTTEEVLDELMLEELSDDQEEEISDEEEASEYEEEEASEEKKEEKDPNDYDENGQKRMTTLEGYSSLWKNPLISDAYEPGSTYKPFTVASCLESGKGDGNITTTCLGYLDVGSHKIGCSHVHNTVDVKKAVALSCNVAMMNLVFRETAPVFYEYQTLFGIGSKTGIDLPGEVDVANLRYYNNTYKNSATLATNAFGQNFNCTMMQLATGFASIINGGEYIVPHMVKELQNSHGDKLKEIGKTVLRNTVSEEVSETLRDYLKETVASGTGTKARIPGYVIGGKTGTAEKIPRNKTDYYISFIGFTPADDPELMIYVTIDEPHVDNQATAALAVLLEREVMTKIIKYLGMKPEVEVKSGDVNYEDIYVDEYTELFDDAFYGGMVYEQYYAEKDSSDKKEEE